MIKLLSVAIFAGFCFASNRAYFIPVDDVCWTGWFDRDNPSGTGDWELLSNLRTDYPGQICKRPWRIEAVTTDTNTPATQTGDVIHIYNSNQGFVCRNTDQKSGMCRDYKVRFVCSCSEMT
ncbi:cartilage intermediate layer protein 1-like [Cebidichthys violaceus]|uniref:cartilage intermediate layer protein 1-like n=1 Tax=Cebidichthys violaceus TaxID=271503 RepID=UPI0035CA00EE